MGGSVKGRLYDTQPRTRRRHRSRSPSTTRSVPPPRRAGGPRRVSTPRRAGASRRVSTPQREGGRSRRISTPVAAGPRRSPRLKSDGVELLILIDVDDSVFPTSETAGRNYRDLRAGGVLLSSASLPSSPVATAPVVTAATAATMASSSSAAGLVAAASSLSSVGGGSGSHPSPSLSLPLAGAPPADTLLGGALPPDTLLGGVRHPAVPTSSVSPMKRWTHKDQRDMTDLDRSLAAFFRTARQQFPNVQFSMVTNASKEWARPLLSKHYFPATTRLFEDWLTRGKRTPWVVSARDLYESQYPNDPVAWKYLAIKQELEYQFSRTSSKEHKSTRKHVMMIADGEVDKCGFAHVARFHMARDPSFSSTFVALPDRPTIPTLTSLWNHIRDSLRKWVATSIKTTTPGRSSPEMWHPSIADQPLSCDKRMQLYAPTRASPAWLALHGIVDLTKLYK